MMLFHLSVAHSVFSHALTHAVGPDLQQGLSTKPLPISSLLWKLGGNVAIRHTF